MPSISKSRRESILRSLPNFCSLCGEGPRENDPWTLDHIVPKALGGGNARGNLQKAHKFCNHLHGAKLHLTILEEEQLIKGYPGLIVDMDRLRAEIQEFLAEGSILVSETAILSL